MALGDTNISVTGVKTELGIGSPNTVSGLNTNVVVNPYSFWSPRSLTFVQNPTYLDIYELTPVTDTAPYQLGDFRRYSHTANTPSLDMINSAIATTPGNPNSVAVVVRYNNWETNLLRADPTITQARVKFFTSLADARANVNPLLLSDGTSYAAYTAIGNGVQVRGINVSPALSGHSVTQTTVPLSQLLINAGGLGIPMNAPYNTTTPVNCYARVDFCDASTNRRGSLPYPNNIYTFTLRYFAQPILNINTQSYSPNPFNDASGSPAATAVFANNAVKNNVNGDTSWNFSFKVAAIWGASGTQERVAGNVQVKYVWDSIEYNIGGVRAFSEGGTVSVTDAITGGLTSLAYDQVITIRLVFTSLTTTYNI